MAMTLQDGYGNVPPGKIAAVVTSLEMFAPVPTRTEAADSRWELRHHEHPDLAWYRGLFRRVGERWLWFSRLVMPDQALAAIVHDPRVEVHALHVGGDAGDPQGIVELDFRTGGECELSFFGVTDDLIGSGAGRWLMNRAILRAWTHPTRTIRRFWVHTCTLDHPSALGFYIRSGFVPYRRQIEIADDPRLTGQTSHDAAPHFPIIEPAS